MWSGGPPTRKRRDPVTTHCVLELVLQVVSELVAVLADKILACRHEGWLGNYAVNLSKHIADVHRGSPDCLSGSTTKQLLQSHVRSVAGKPVCGMQRLLA